MSSLAADDGFYVEMVADGPLDTQSVDTTVDGDDITMLEILVPAEYLASTLDDPDQALPDEAMTVTPLAPPEWIEHDELGLPGVAGPQGPPSFLILNPGDPIPPNTPASVVYRLRA